MDVLEHAGLVSLAVRLAHESSFAGGGLARPLKIGHILA
jgi:hypothetical protein